MDKFMKISLIFISIFKCVLHFWVTHLYFAEPILQIVKSTDKNYKLQQEIELKFVKTITLTVSAKTSLLKKSQNLSVTSPQCQCD